MAGVLVVDDDSALLGLVTMLLQQGGYTVLSTSNGVEALMVYSSYRSSIDLVLSDVLMPGMNGVELAGRLRALNPALPILLMSGFVPDEIAIPEDLQLIPKPFNPSRLVEMIEEALAPTKEPH
jgi:CheY-like chemotaxis protein